MTPQVTLNGTAMPATFLDEMLSVRVDREVGNTGRATLRFADDGYKIAATSAFALGVVVAIDVINTEAPGHSGSLFTGIVTGVAVEHDGVMGPELVVTADDKSVLLGFANRITTYSNVTDSDVLSTLLSQNGLTASVTHTSIVHTYLMQNGSDRAMLDTLVERCGLVWWMSGSTVHVAEPDTVTTGPSLGLGAELFEFSVRGSGLRPTGVTVSGWDAKQAQPVSAQPTAPAARSVAPFVARFGDAKVTAGLGTAERLEASLAPETQQDAEAIATGLTRRWRAETVVARGRTHVRADIDLMTRVTVTDAGPLSGDYVVTAVEHVLTPGGLDTRFVAGPLRPAGLVDTLGHPGGPDALALGGLYSAVVSNIDDPDNLGRVKVKYVALASHNVESNWARVVAAGGGGGRGAVFHPEVNDEVLIGFERGDSRHPVVIGGLYSSSAALPTVKDGLVRNGKTQSRTITSRLGHVVALNDEDDPAKGGLTLTHKDGHVLRLGGDTFALTMAANKPISITTGQASIKLDASGNVTIKGVKITLDAQTEVAVTGSTEVSVHSSGTLDLKGVTATLKGDAQVTVQGGGMAEIKGGLVKIN